MRYAHIIAAVQSEPWAILPEKLRVIEAFLADKARGVVYSQEEIQARIGGAKERAVAQKSGAVAVLPIHGTIAHRMGSLVEASGGISTERLAGWFRAAVNDEGVKAIVFDIDSPGGAVGGVEELAADIHAARGKKPIIAVANSMAASGAYWLASQADEVVVSPTGSVGSIGVYAAHVDQSEAMRMEGLSVTLIQAGKHKTEGHPYGPLGDEAREEIQRKVDTFYAMFTRSVRRGRGNVSSDVMQGRMYLAEDAKRNGLADSVGTLDSVIARFAGEKGRVRYPRDLLAIEQEILEIEAMK